MRSSSRLFPVSLVSAELRGDLSEDVYLLKPNNSPDNSVELAMTRLGQTRQEQPGPAVILLHGSFSNRRFWYSPRTAGLAVYLARQGFDVWLPEMRGHGLSPRNQDYRNNSVAGYARHDLPAMAAFVQEMNPRPAHWLGHSLGGATLAAALGGGHLAVAGVASVTLLGTQVSQGYWWLKIPPLEWGLRGYLRCLEQLRSRGLSAGPEDEPPGVARDLLRWHRLFGRFGQHKDDWWQGLAQVALPLLVVSGGGDRGDPEPACRALGERFAGDQRHFLCLGTAEGFSQDYGHLDMLLSKAAQREVWPLLAGWLAEGRLAR